MGEMAITWIFFLQLGGEWFTAIVAIIQNKYAAD